MSSTATVVVMLPEPAGRALVKAFRDMVPDGRSGEKPTDRPRPSSNCDANGRETLLSSRILEIVDVGGTDSCVKLE
jgi:hypothetical protein